MVMLASAAPAGTACPPLTMMITSKQLNLAPSAECRQPGVRACLFSRWYPPTVARGVWGTHLLAGRRFDGGKCVCWWNNVRFLLVKRA